MIKGWAICLIISNGILTDDGMVPIINMTPRMHYVVVTEFYK